MKIKDNKCTKAPPRNPNGKMLGHRLIGNAMYLKKGKGQSSKIRKGSEHET